MRYSAILRFTQRPGIPVLEEWKKSLKLKEPSENQLKALMPEAEGPSTRTRRQVTLKKSAQPLAEDVDMEDAEESETEIPAGKKGKGRPAPKKKKIVISDPEETSAARPAKSQPKRGHNNSPVQSQANPKRLRTTRVLKTGEGGRTIALQVELGDRTFQEDEIVDTNLVPMAEGKVSLVIATFPKARD